MSCSFKQQFQCKRNKRYIHTKSTGVKWASRHKRLYREHLLWTWHNFYCVGDVICQLYSNIQQSSTQTSYFSWYLKFYTCRRCFAVTINFLRSFEGNYWRVATNIYRRHMVIVLYQKQNAEYGFQRFKDFNVWNTECERPPKKLQDAELQTILNEDETWFRNKSHKCWTTTNAAGRLQVMRIIQKSGKWVQHVLNDRQMENWKFVLKILLQRCDIKLVMHRILNKQKKIMD